MPVFVFISLLLAWIGCYLPWSLTLSTAFSANLFDLAEWSSLDSAVRYANPPLLPTVFLRLTVGLIAFALASQADTLTNRAVRWIVRIVALLIGIGLLPPLEFFRGAFGDPNYRQQLVIALVTCLAALGAVFGPPRLPGKTVRLAGLAACVAALGCTLLGAFLSINALNAFRLNLVLGGGAALTALTLFCAILLQGAGIIQNAKLAKGEEAQEVN